MPALFAPLNTSAVARSSSLRETNSHCDVLWLPHSQNKLLLADLNIFARNTSLNFLHCVLGYRTHEVGSHINRRLAEALQVRPRS